MKIAGGSASNFCPKTPRSNASRMSDHRRVRIRRRRPGVLRCFFCFLTWKAWTWKGVFFLTFFFRGKKVVVSTCAIRLFGTCSFSENMRLLSIVFVILRTTSLKTFIPPHILKQIGCFFDHLHQRWPWLFNQRPNKFNTSAKFKSSFRWKWMIQKAYWAFFGYLNLSGGKLFSFSVSIFPIILGEISNAA